jgi:lantibiotic modifying enzyme
LIPEWLANAEVTKVLEPVRSSLSSVRQSDVSIDDLCSSSPYHDWLRNVMCTRLAKFIRKAEADIRVALKLSPEVDVSFIKRLSDFHNSLSHTFEFEIGGRHMVYKPRSNDSQELFSGLLGIFECCAGRVVSPDTVAIGNDFSIQYKAESLISVHSEERHYQLGLLAGLLYLVRGYDLHYENVIFTQSELVFVDAECLFAPWGNGEWCLSDTGAFMGLSDQHSDFWLKPPSVLHIPNFVPIQDARNSREKEPALLGSTDCLNAFTEGVSTIVASLTKQKVVAILELISSFRDAHFRFVFRDTVAYAQLLQRAVLTNFGNSSTQVFSYFLKTLGDNELGLQEKEASSLIGYDIPIFHHRPTEIGILQSGGANRRHFPNTSYDLVKKHLNVTLASGPDKLIAEVNALTVKYSSLSNASM